MNKPIKPNITVTIDGLLASSAAWVFLKPKTSDQAVRLWRKASRAYQRDCNLRWIRKPDKRRLDLRRKGKMSFLQLYLSLTEE